MDARSATTGRRSIREARRRELLEEYRQTADRTRSSEILRELNAIECERRAERDFGITVIGRPERSMPRPQVDVRALAAGDDRERE